jgi:hypothetical protein
MYQQVSEIFNILPFDILVFPLDVFRNFPNRLTNDFKISDYRRIILSILFKLINHQLNGRPFIPPAFNEICKAPIWNAQQIRH